MQTAKLVTIELPNGHLVVRVTNGPRLGTIFSTGQGWCYQFDGASQEGPVCQDAMEALGVMEVVAEREHLITQGTH